MPSLQYVIDSICANFTVESIYELIEIRLKQGPFIADEILPLIQSKDRSLDSGSAKMIAEAALVDLAQRGNIRTDGNHFFPVK